MPNCLPDELGDIADESVAGALDFAIIVASPRETEVDYSPTASDYFEMASTTAIVKSKNFDVGKTLGLGRVTTDFDGTVSINDLRDPLKDLASDQQNIFSESINKEYPAASIMAGTLQRYGIKVSTTRHGRCVGATHRIDLWRC